MRDETPSLDRLFTRWRRLPRGDRKAILRHLTPDRRLDFEMALAAHTRDGETSPAGECARKYAACSAWLADIFTALDDAEAAERMDGPMPTPAVRDALQEAHAKAEECAARDYRPSLLDLARSAILNGGGKT